jgi:XTP/dITP diphosphohydrolase
MKKLVFATNNKHKLYEVRELLKNECEILGLNDIGCTDDIAETSHTLEGNASLKSSYVFKKYKLNCFADDTGLEIEVLNGKPGVFSARYAGVSHGFEANLQKVLAKLKDKKNRKARFRTAISLILDGKEYFFEGIVNGEIINEKRGTDGFGYDPIFSPEDYDQTFAEMELIEKNKISHRGRAIKNLVDFLKTV